MKFVGSIIFGNRLLHRAQLLYYVRGSNGVVKRNYIVIFHVGI
jgi:hypothetical protein